MSLCPTLFRARRPGPGRPARERARAMGLPAAFGVLLGVALALALAAAPVARAEEATDDDFWRELEARRAAVERLLEEGAAAPGEATEPYLLASPHAVLVSWRTENPAQTFVEYGKTGEYGSRTPLSEVSSVSGRPTWSHFHRLVGLEPGTRYHYRTVAVGGDGEAVRGADATFETPEERAAIRIPEEVQGPPWVLDRPHATYRLTRDVEAPAAGITLAAPGITLDFDGHTLTYDTEGRTWPEKTSRNIKVREVHGVFVDRSARRAARILNGRIVQGEGKSDGTTDAIGSNPIYALEVGGDLEVAGMELVWAGDGVSGLYLHWGDGVRVHHCVFDDRGTVVYHRHMAVSSVDGNGNHHYEHNLVRSTRQQGLIGAVTAIGNEVYVDSRATNSVAINMGSSKEPVKILDNRVVGIGQHPIGFGMFGMFAPGSVVADNLAIVECTREGREYGWTGSACARTTWGADNLHLRDNVFVGLCSTRPEGRNGVTGQTRVLWMGLPALDVSKGAWQGTKREPAEVRGMVERNVILALGRDDTAHAGALCVVCQNRSPNLIFRENLVVSSYGNVVLADRYGSSEHFSKYVGNRFVRTGTQSNYETIRADNRYSDAQGSFLANTYEAGASEESVKASAKTIVVFCRPFAVRVEDAAGQPVAGATVVVTDAEGQEVFRAETAAQDRVATLVSEIGPGFRVALPPDAEAPGRVEATTVPAGSVVGALPATTVTQAGRAPAGPYAVRAEVGERRAEARLEPGGDWVVELRP